MNGPHASDDLLVALALDDPEAARRDDVVAHVRDCSECARVVADLKGALARYRDAPPPEAPARVLVRLLETQSAARERRRFWPRARRPAAALAFAAMLAAVFVGGYWAGRHAAPEDAPPTVEMPLRQPLPEPPVVAFQVAAALE